MCNESSGSQNTPGVYIAMGMMEEELARCHPTEQDFARAWDTVEECSRTIEANHFSAAAYHDRALTLAFLGQQEESRRDQEQAARLGIDSALLEEELDLMRQIAIGGLYEENVTVPSSFLSRSAGWLSTISSLLGR